MLLRFMMMQRSKSPESTTPARATYRIGPVCVELVTSIPDVAAAYHALYAPFAVDRRSDDGDATYQVRVFRRRSWRSGLAHFHIESDVEDTFTVRRMSRVLPHVEGAVNLCIAHYMPRYLMLHAAALTRNGVGVVIPGGPGFGKTTLAAALTARGWQYASDEFAMIDPRDGSLTPYPKALSIKSGSFELLRAFGVPVGAAPEFDRADKGAIRLLPAAAFRPDAIASRARIALVVFPDMALDRPPSAALMSQAEGVFEMSRRCFNLLRFRSQAIETLADVARQAPCVRLQTGELDATCRLLERTMDALLEKPDAARPAIQSLHAA